MGRANKDVGGYRGRRTATDVLRLIAIILGVLVVLAVAGMLYLQKYLVYTDEGPKLELPPFLQMLRGDHPSKEPGGSASLPDPGSVSVVVDPGGSGSEAPPEEKKAGFALQLAVDDVVSGAAAAQLDEAGAEALILEVKGQSGKLAWLSEQAVAKRSRANGSQEAGDALRRWNQGDVYTVARVCCFRDDSAPYYHNAMALRQGQNNWRDELGLRWLSPANDRSQAYVAGLCGELAELGFDEIVLEQFSFPVRGKLDRINRGDSYDPARFNAELEELLTQVQRAVEPYGAGTVVSLRLTGDMLGEGSAASGVTPELLQRFGGRIWSDGEGLSLLPDLPDEQKVEVVPQAGEDREFFQAVLPAEK